jgi:hypothetical protein
LDRATQSHSEPQRARPAAEHDAPQSGEYADAASEAVAQRKEGGATGEPGAAAPGPASSAPDNSPTVAAQRRLSAAIDGSPRIAAQRKRLEGLFGSDLAGTHSAPPAQLQAVVQMKGYKLSAAADPMAIKEQEYGSGKSIRFTTFTSCIGIIGKKGDGTLVGIHLVRFSLEGEPFDKEDVPTVKAALGGASDITIIGQTDFWEEDLLGAFGGSVKGGTDDGSFGATLDGTGKIVVKKA